MAKRFDICAPRSGKDDKTYWTKIGTAWQKDKGGIQLVFDALPIPDKEGRVVANLFEPKDREQTGGTRAPAKQAAGGWGGRDNLDDDVPF